MPRYTKKDKDGRYYIESVNGRLESNIFGHTYGEAIDRFAQLENADVVPRDEVRRIFEEIEQEIVAALESNYRVYREHLEKYGDKPNLEFLCMCNAKVNALRGIEGFIAEIKEKYTKGGEQ